MKTLFKAALLAVLCICFLAGCGDDPVVTEPSEQTTAPSDPAPTVPKTVDYTAQVTNMGGLPLDGVRVKIFPDSSLVNLVDMGLSDAEGMFSFTAEASDAYVAVLQNLPEGYEAEACYQLTGEHTVIRLGAGELTEEKLDSLNLTLGSPMPDFTVTTPDGTMLTLSSLLAEKDAVVLNFWNLSCTPCKMEFPHLQEAFEQLGDDVAVLALDPYDQDQGITDFQSENGYTFTMAACDFRWERMLSLKAYPTTVVIDRFGNISLIHTGSVPAVQPFLDMFEFFSADEYKQTFVEDLEQLSTFEPA